MPDYHCVFVLLVVCLPFVNQLKQQKLSIQILPWSLCHSVSCMTSFAIDLGYHFVFCIHFLTNSIKYPPVLVWAKSTIKCDVKNKTQVKQGARRVWIQCNDCCCPLKSCCSTIILQVCPSFLLTCTCHLMYYCYIIMSHTCVFCAFFIVLKV